jgi:hypothetical protein
MTIGKQKPRERVGFEPTVQRFSSSKVRMLWRLFWFAGEQWPNLGRPKGLRQRMIAK